MASIPQIPDPKVGIIAKLGGRKFLMALLALLAIALNSWLGLDANTVMTVGAIAIGYIFAEGGLDAIQAKTNSNVAVANAEVESARIDAISNNISPDMSQAKVQAVSDAFAAPTTDPIAEAVELNTK